MSKSPNILFPALGATGLVLGAAYGLTARDYKAQEAEVAVAQAQAAEERAAEAKEMSTELAAVIAQLEERAAKADMTAAAPVSDGRFGLGRPAVAAEIAAWDVDVLPDGRGLPAGQGDVWTGEEVFVEKCGACHGDFAEGVDNWPVLAGGFDTLADEDPVKTVGSYWPHLSTAFDYIYRSMPFGEAGTLTPDETYAIVAYLLYSNDMVDDDFVLSDENFSSVEMHNAHGFVIDDRGDLEYAEWRAEPCMENCKEEVSVTMRSVFLVETPPEGGSESVMNTHTLDGIPSFTAEGPSFIPAAAPKPAVEDTAPEPAVQEATAETGDEAALVAAGEKVFKKCKSCHQVGPGAKNRSGPQLTGIMGRGFASVEGFKYSNVFLAAAEEGRTWTQEEMVGFLTKPKAYMKGTKMGFAGLGNPEDIAAVIAYLNAADTN